MVELVIKVPEKLACEGFERSFTEEEKDVLIKAIGNGTPLPKGHGRLIDETMIPYSHGVFEDGTAFTIIHPWDIENVRTIVESDKQTLKVSDEYGINCAKVL